MNYQKIKAISKKGLTKDLFNKFSIINGAKYLSSGMFQSCLVSITAKNHIKYLHVTTTIHSWKSCGISEESTKNITKSDSNFVPSFVDHHSLPDINFNGHCLIKRNISIPKKVIHLHISYT